MDEDQTDKIISKVDDYYDFTIARKKFIDKFQERTGCKWNKREFFEEKPGKFKLVDQIKKAEVR